MLKARLILVALIGGSPAILLVGGLAMHALVAGVVAIALVIVARSLRPAETEFLVSLTRPLAFAAAVPALWVLFQILPLNLFVHPIWISAAQALGRPVTGAISVDPGASVIALGQYLSMAAVTFLSAAVAVDRQRAEWLLFALAGACTAIALGVLIHDLFFPGIRLTAFARSQIVDCAGMGAIIAGAVCIRAIERYETRHTNPDRSIPILRWTLGSGAAALVICAAALIFDATYWTIFALGCGLVSLACVLIIRRFVIGAWGALLVTATALAAAVLLLAAHPAEHDRSVLLAFGAAPSASLTSLSERVLEDAPLVGTGAGTFGALAPVYREIDDPPPGAAAATATAAFAIELGKPMLWLIMAAAAASILVLLRAALRRGRDSFYPAMGGGCLITVMLLAFTNAGLLG
ncbi:MAG: hypothetical protein ACRECE_09430, partial [Xanthobacteraceae bacterium]